VALIGGAILVIGPWALRSSVLAGGPVPVQCGGVVNVYVPTRIDLDQANEATLWTAFGSGDEYGRRLADSRSASQLCAADELGARLALENIRANPAGYLRSRARAFPHLLVTSYADFFDTQWSLRQAVSEASGLFMLRVSFLIVFSLAPLALGIRRLLRDPRRLACPTTLMWTGTALAHVPLWIEPRFFYPVAPFLFLDAAAEALANRTGGRSRLPLRDRADSMPNPQRNNRAAKSIRLRRRLDLL
jgi:hypothetical protein